MGNGVSSTALAQQDFVNVSLPDASTAANGDPEINETYSALYKKYSQLVKSFNIEDDKHPYSRQSFYLGSLMSMILHEPHNNEHEPIPYHKKKMLLNIQYFEALNQLGPLLTEKGFTDTESKEIIREFLDSGAELTDRFYRIVPKEIPTNGSVVFIDPRNALNVKLFQNLVNSIKATNVMLNDPKLENIKAQQNARRQMLKTLNSDPEVKKTQNKRLREQLSAVGLVLLGLSLIALGLVTAILSLPSVTKGGLWIAMGCLAIAMTGHQYKQKAKTDLWNTPEERVIEKFLKSSDSIKDKVASLQPSFWIRLQPKPASKTPAASQPPQGFVYLQP